MGWGESCFHARFGLGPELEPNPDVQNSSGPQGTGSWRHWERGSGDGDPVLVPLRRPHCSSALPETPVCAPGPFPAPTGTDWDGLGGDGTRPTEVVAALVCHPDVGGPSRDLGHVHVPKITWRRAGSQGRARARPRGRCGEGVPGLGPPQGEQGGGGRGLEPCTGTRGAPSWASSSPQPGQAPRGHWIWTKGFWAHPGTPKHPWGPRGP